MFATVAPPPQRLLVFARLPERGKVKTRLASAIGDERALAVYEAMLRDVIASIGDATPELEIEFLWPPSSSANGALLRRAFAHHAVAMQTGAGAGDRLAMAFAERFFFHRTEKIIAIGVDDPTLSRELLDHAFALLDSVEWILGPAHGGGYSMIGCRAASFDPEFFEGIEWGSPTVFARTLAKIRATERTLAVLPRRYDIETAEDLERFAREGHDTELGRLLR